MIDSNVKSMTGYGKGNSEYEGSKITVEIKTLNSKQMDLSLRIPSIYREREFEIRSRVSKALTRGKADVFITLESISGKKSIPINSDVFTDYFNQLDAISQKVGIDMRNDNTIAAILRLPDVLQMDSSKVSDNEWKALDKAVGEAIANLNSFREQEGKVLMADLLERIAKIESLKESVIPFENSRIEVVKARLRENIESLNITVDNNRFEQEMIYYLEKYDITEEKIRLQNHLNYFREVSTEEAAGRKIGFICQEIGREINTLGSKANNTDIQRFVVEMKDELEKIKEQVLNIL